MSSIYPPTEMGSAETTLIVTDALYAMASAGAGLVVVTCADEALPRYSVCTYERHEDGSITESDVGWRTAWHTPVQAIAAWLRDQRRDQQARSQEPRTTA